MAYSCRVIKGVRTVGGIQSMEGVNKEGGSKLWAVGCQIMCCEDCILLDSPF